MKKIIVLSTAVLGMIVATPTLAGEFSGKVGLASQYLGKGLGKSDEDPAFNGSVRWTQDGFYADAFVSQAASTRDAESEVILTGGYVAEFGGFDLDSQLLYREMTGEENGIDSGYFEAQFDLSRDFGKTFSGRLRVNYSPDTYGATDEAWWVEAQGGAKIYDGGKLTAAYGLRRTENGTDYDAWNIGVKHKFTKAISGDLRWYDTDGHDFGERYEGRLVAALTYSF
ncbi:TorF family putative porin [Caulobacter sp. NIBR1757]|uniref:TorF family putative porin n=1 Tax=Caulobacter sp. NIBR1757 TaxID=3016000 RepID=UPI0022F0227D|nr:TorF family putative porin [Caulobacter sp. NIBR1757]WGM39904.1 hypothetical protein AMEJIAPC_02844 [Caulobacter sp. NIBR1757]